MLADTPPIDSDYPVIGINYEYGFNDRYTFTDKSGSSTPIAHGLILALNDGGILPDGSYKQRLVCCGKDNPLSKGELVNVVNSGFLYNVNWERDYFTSSHLRKQLGSPIAFPVDSSFRLQLPAGTDIGITSNDKNKVLSSATTNQNLTKYSEILTSSFFMNDLRLVSAISQLQEGSLMSPKTFEYSSYLKFFFGTSPSTKDMLQPYFIGGFNSTFFTQEVTQTSSSSSPSNALGDYAGKGQSIDSGYIDSYTHNEIGLELIVMYIVPRKTVYSSQGINRQWLRRSRYEYYNPVFAHLGFQEVQNQELFAIGDTKIAQQPFGYTMSFNELRYMSDVVTSDMRDELDFWHLGRNFNGLPKLNSTFLLCRPSKRIFDIIDPDQSVITGRINITTSAYRDLPELGIPELLDHRY